jgi:hypothetical protein
MRAQLEGRWNCAAGQEPIMTLSRTTGELKLMNCISECVSVAKISRTNVAQRKKENFLSCWNQETYGPYSPVLFRVVTPYIFVGGNQRYGKNAASIFMAVDLYLRITCIQEQDDYREK